MKIAHFIILQDATEWTALCGAVVRPNDFIQAGVYAQRCPECVAAAKISWATVQVV